MKVESRRGMRGKGCRNSLQITVSVYSEIEWKTLIYTAKSLIYKCQNKYKEG